MPEPLQLSLVQLTLRLAGEFKKSYGRIGNLSALQTTQKTSLVQAINEVRSLTEKEQIVDDTQLSTTKSFSSLRTVSLVGSLLSDSTIDSSHTWSSSKIRASINEELLSLLRTSPEVLGSLSEISSLLESDPESDALLVTLANRVRFDTIQSLTESQRLQARENIGVRGIFLDEDGVPYFE